MQTLDPTEDDETGTVYRDVIMLALAGFVALVILLLPHLNPPGEKTADNIDPPGNVIIEVRWPDEMDSDVDLWVQAPGDMPVGYSNKGGVIFNLLRDDLGRRADATGMNYEVSYSRGIPPGEYTVNVHLYRNPARTFPIPVTVVTSVKKTAKESAKQILASKLDLDREGQESTVFRFELDEDGDLVPGSVHNLQTKLRSWKKS
ncbi:MAG: hypothetical protein KDH19_10270 [Geminicoccaceae bacterium]|nr:hypothetical protein [Geminicoccaceae bacterium]MCB2012903.1 hypothetical protein [Geminicoccaceae bacterium]